MLSAIAAAASRDRRGRSSSSSAPSERVSPDVTQSTAQGDGQRRVDGPDRERGDGGAVACDGAEQAERRDEREVGECEPADRAVAAPEQHSAVTRKRLDEPALSAPFLGERGAQALRGSRRGNGLPDEREPVRQPSIAAVAVQAEDELEILSRDVGVVAAGVDDGVAAQHPDRAHPPEQQRPESPDALHAREQRPLRRDARAGAARDGLRVRLERACHAHQRVTVEPHGRVDRAEQRKPGEAEAGVDGVGPSSAGLSSTSRR